MDGKLKLTKLRTYETPSFGPGGAIENAHVAQFYVGHHGPFMVEMPAAEYTPEKFRDAIRAKVTEVNETAAL